MEVARKDIDKLNAEITISIKEEDYKQKVTQSLNRYRKQANMPGFRKGMVPMGMVKKMVGTNILVEEINQILSENLNKYIGENKLNILGNPLPKEDDSKAIDWDNQKEFDFTYELGLAPEVKVDLTEKDKFDFYKIKVSDKMVEEQIQEIAKRYGKMVDADQSEEEDMLYGKFEELEKGAVKEDGITNGTVLNIRTITKSKDQKKFIGLKPGDVVKFKPQGIADDKYVAAWLGIEEEYIKDQKSEFQFTVEKINRMEAAELNQEFFDKIYGPNQVSSKEEMGAKLRAEMEQSFAQNAEQFLEREVQDYLLKKAKLNLPNEFMKKWLKMANEKPVTQEQIEEEYDQYAQGLKWQLIENKLIKENDIKVEKEEVVEHTKNLVRQQMAGMGQNMMDDAALEDTANRVLENQDESRRLYEQLYQLKMREFYKKTVKLKEREISYDDFVKLAEKKSTKK
ncbi:MAG: trigger factor [Vicingaceae bacterium]